MNKLRLYRNLVQKKNRLSKLYAKKDRSKLDPKIFELTHLIETEKFNASDMYAIVKAIQFNLTRDDKEIQEIEDFLNEHGGLSGIDKIKMELIDEGVEPIELY